MIKISVIGLGYVGLPVSCVFAQAGYNVLGVDVSEHVVKTLGSGKVHIKEDGLQSLFENAVETGNLKISSKIKIQKTLTLFF